MWSFKKWWHDGEGTSCQVFRQSWRTAVVMAAAMAVAIWLIPALHETAAYAAFVLVLARGSLERRRAVVLTPDSLGVRGAFAATQFISRSDVEAVESANVAGSFLLMPRPVKGLRIRLRSGGAFYIPLDLPRHEKVAEKIRNAALPPSDGERGAGRTPRKT